MLNAKTLEIIEHLNKAIKENNQQLINIYACELASILYTKDCGNTMQEIIEGFGYKEIQPDPRQISIEEYMRGRK